jgi:hypothetical protein
MGNRGTDTQGRQALTILGGSDNVANTKIADERRYYITKLDEQNGRLIDLLKQNHSVIEGNSATNVKLVGTIEQMQSSLAIMITQFNANIASQRDGVPVKVFLIVVGVMAAIIAVVIGLDVTKVVTPP